MNQRRRNCLNITVFFQWDKYNGNVIETNKIFPLHVFNVLLFQYLLQSLLSVCFTCLVSKDVWLPIPFKKACSLHQSPSQSSLHFCLSLNTVTEKTAVCCLHNPEKLHRFYSVVCYRTLLAALQVSVSRVKPPTTSSKMAP